MDTTIRKQSGRALLYFTALGVFAILLAFYGTSLYNYYIPAIALGRDFSLGIPLIAVIAGVASFFSPCAFGMLPAYFSYHFVTDSKDLKPESLFRTSLKRGIFAASGMVLVAFILASLILTLGVTFAPSLRIVTMVPNPYSQAIRIAVGLSLIFLGITNLAGKNYIGSLAYKLTNKTSPVRPVSYFMFGLIYLTAAIPCTANIMAAPLLFSAGTQGYSGIAITIVIFTLTLASLMITMSVLTGLAKRRFIHKMQAATPHIQKGASILLIAMGIALIYFDINTEAFKNTFFKFPIKG